MIALEKSNILITGVARNCAFTLISDIEKLSLAFKNAQKIYFLVIESDSDDGTLDTLNFLSCNNTNFEFISHGSLTHSLPQRTNRIAYCRNTYVNEIITNDKYKLIDYVVVADLDGINSEISSEAVASCWNYDNWAAMTANQDGPYYDIWALRHEQWSPNDCWNQYDFYNKMNYDNYDNLKTAVYSRMLVIPKEHDLIEVESAFAGFAIYDALIFKYCTYNGLNSDNSEVCEHVYFNKSILNSGKKIYINPKLINANYTEHTNHLKNKSFNVLKMSKYGQIIINVNKKSLSDLTVRNNLISEDPLNLIIELLKLRLQTQNNVTFYDIGASSGLYSLAVAKSFGDKVNIRSFESQRMVFNMLCGTVALNGYLNIYCYNLLISSQSTGLIKIDIPNHYSCTSFNDSIFSAPEVSNDYILSNSLQDYVSTSSIDSFNEKIDFIKINSNGMEEKILLGVKDTTLQSRPIFFISINSCDLNFIFNYFKTANYACYQNSIGLFTIPNEFEINLIGIEKLF